MADSTHNSIHQHAFIKASSEKNAIACLEAEEFGPLLHAAIREPAMKQAISDIIHLINESAKLNKPILNYRDPETGGTVLHVIVQENISPVILSALESGNSVPEYYIQDEHGNFPLDYVMGATNPELIAGMHRLKSHAEGFCFEDYDAINALGAESLAHTGQKLEYVAE